MAMFICALGVTHMPRPCQLPVDGLRRTITFRPDLDEKLAMMAAQRRVPISTIVEECVERGLRSSPTPESLAVEFPANWDASDLRQRLYYLRMRQSELAEALNVPVKTLNHWVCGRGAFDKKKWVPRIQKALMAHEPPPIGEFRAGSRSPLD